MNFQKYYRNIVRELEAVFDKIDQKNVEEFMDTVSRHKRVFLIGVGREGMATKAFAMRLMHMGKEVHWIWNDTTPSIEQGDLLIATLGDGEIGHIHYVCSRAKEQGAFLYVVTGSPSGKTASSLADKVLFVPAKVYRGKDEVVDSFQPMGNLFEQSLLILFDIIVMLMVDKDENLSFEKMSARHRNIE